MSVCTLSEGSSAFPTFEEVENFRRLRWPLRARNCSDLTRIYIRGVLFCSDLQTAALVAALGSALTEHMHWQQLLLLFFE